jgi:hypothetical protein
LHLIHQQVLSLVYQNRSCIWSLLSTYTAPSWPQLLMCHTGLLKWPVNWYSWSSPCSPAVYSQHGSQSDFLFFTTQVISCHSSAPNFLLAPFLFIEKSTLWYVLKEPRQSGPLFMSWCCLTGSLISVLLAFLFLKYTSTLLSWGHLLFSSVWNALSPCAWLTPSFLYISVQMSPAYSSLWLPYLP